MRCSLPSPRFSGYRMHTSRLPIVRRADSMGHVIDSWSEPWGSTLDWGGLATAAWKKGGRLACGPGGAALLVYSTAGGATVAGDAVYALPAQSFCNSGRDGVP